MFWRVFGLFLNELSKRWRSKLAWLGALAVAAASFLWPQGAIIAGVGSHFTGFAFLRTVAATVFESVIPLFAILFAAGLVASEAQLGTDRTVLCGPVRRGEWLAAKFLVALLYAGALAAVHVGTGIWSAARFGFEFKGYEEFGEIVVPLRTTALAHAAAYGWLLLPMFAAASFGFALSVVARGPGSAMGAGAGLFAVATLFRPMLKFGGLDLEPWFFLSHVGAPLRMAEEIGSAMGGGWWTPGLRQCAITSAGTIAVCVAVSFWTFQRRDLAG